MLLWPPPDPALFVPVMPVDPLAVLPRETISAPEKAPIEGMIEEPENGLTPNPTQVRPRLSTETEFPPKVWKCVGSVMVWECDWRSAATVSAPPVDPRARLLSPEPWPAPTIARLFGLGMLNVVEPSPEPYVVPQSPKSPE